MKEYACTTCIRKKYGNLPEKKLYEIGWRPVALFEHAGKEMQMKCGQCGKGFYYMYFRKK